jgi:hypothetical protein
MTRLLSYQYTPPTFSIISTSQVPISLAHFSNTFRPFQLFNPAWSNLWPRHPYHQFSHFKIHKPNHSLLLKFLKKLVFITTTSSTSQTTSYQMWYTYKTIQLLRTHLPSYQFTPPTFSIFSASEVPISLVHFSGEFPTFQLFNPAWSDLRLRRP